MSNGTTVEKPELVVFSSGKVAHAGITGAIRDELSKRGFTVTLWTEGFFPVTEIALKAFLKQLLCYDAAVVVLGDDDIRRDPGQTRSEQHVPRDNVIFELGACMSRLGTKKTFIVCPDSPEVVLPSYFLGVGRLTYETTRTAANPNAAVGSACDAVAREFANFDRSAFFSDLPAGGLAYGYFQNFLLPTYNAFSAAGGRVLIEATKAAPSRSGSGRAAGKRSRRPTLDEGFRWTLGLGFKLSVLMPDQPLNRDQVQRLLTAPEPVDVAGILGDGRARAPLSRRLRFVRLQVSLLDGRDITIYSAQRANPGDPFNIVDVPTTLLTSREVIREVDAFWGAGDLRFQRDLVHREALSFGRTLAKLIADSGKAAGIEIIRMADFETNAFQS
jgi:hypothetical protein